MLSVPAWVIAAAVVQQREEANATLEQLLPAAAELAAAREAIAGRLAGAEREVMQQEGRLRHVEDQVRSHGTCSC